MSNADSETVINGDQMSGSDSEEEEPSQVFGNIDADKSDNIASNLSRKRQTTSTFLEESSKIKNGRCVTEVWQTDKRLRQK